MNALGWWALLGLAGEVLAVVWLAVVVLAIVGYAVGCAWLEFEERRERRFTEHVDQALAVAAAPPREQARLRVVGR